jgi:hypothetical protein
MNFSKVKEWYLIEFVYLRGMVVFLIIEIKLKKIDKENVQLCQSNCRWWRG